MDIDPGRTYSISLEDGTLTEGAGDLTGSDLEALNHFATCDIKTLFTAKASDKVLADLKTFTTCYMSFQFDKEYNSLDILDKT